MLIVFHESVNSPYEALISLFSRSWCNHVELVFDQVLEHGPNWFSADGSKGVRFAHGPTRKGDWTDCRLPISPQQEVQLYNWAQQQLGCDYDWLGVCRFVDPLIPLFPAPHPTRWFCSEICLAGLQEIGWFPGLQPHRCAPADLQRLIEWKLQE